MATILIVDDLAENREFVAAVVSREGHRAVHASGGAEALQAACAEAPDLIITDVLMPVMDGYELFRQLRANPATSAIPVIFYTAHYAQQEATALALSNGVAHVIEKGASNKEVIATVNRVLAHSADNSLDGPTVPVADSFNRDHLRLLTDMLSEKTEDLRDANARLRAIINIGLDFATDRDPDVRLEMVCRSVRDLFSASYAALALPEADGQMVVKSYCGGVEEPGAAEAEAAIQAILATACPYGRTIRRDNAAHDGGYGEAQSFLVSPIASPRRIYGWMCLVKTNESRFIAGDEELLQALGGQIGRICELDSEIRERRSVEKLLRQEHDRAELYLDTAQVMLLALDAAGLVTAVNRYGCKLLGWTEAELIGRNWVETCLPEAVRDDLRGKLGRLHAGQLTAWQNQVLTKSGEEIRMEWRNTVLHDQSGRVTGTLSSGTDITLQAKAADALVRAEERMRFVLGGANVGIWDIDFRTGILEWSEVLERQYGLEPGAFPGTFDAFIDCIHPLDRSDVEQTIGEHIRSGGDFALTHRTLWPDGTVRWLNGTGRIYLADGVAVRGVGVSRDVTEQRSADERTQQAQRMEAVGRLASGVAHDFNNLLTVILGFAELMAADSALESQHGDDLDEILKAAKRAAGLTSQLLAFSRQQVLNPSAIDLNTLIDGMAGMFSRLIGEHIEVALSLAPDLDFAVADRGQIEQVVMNLVVNARDAMPKGGKLRLATANVQLENSSFHEQSMKEGGYVMFSVTDSGEGMTRETQARLFEPFFTTKGAGNGTGLGLSTTYGIVKQSKGYIWVYSEPGLGATFKVYLPCATNDSVTNSLPHTPQRPHRRVTETLLLVEDEAGVREFSRRTLANAGYRVLEASNGDEAEALFARHSDSIDLVISDVVMPGCGGPELLARIWLTSPDANVLYMSGYTDQPAVTETDAGGQKRFLQKPFMAAELLRRVRGALGHGDVMVS